jgi:hypothetical protein
MTTPDVANMVGVRGGESQKRKLILTNRKSICYTVTNTDTSNRWRPLMLQLSLGYVVQADREREVADDLRARQTLQSSRESRSPQAPSSGPSLGARRGQAQARVRGTSA